jgi:transcriptional regulator with XRE-family HTH domain
MPPTVDPRFAARLREAMAQRGMSFRHLAGLAHYSSSYLHDLAVGKKAPTLDAAQRLDDALSTGGTLTELLSPAETGGDDELDALELARRVDASDVSTGTLTRLERAVDELATAYARTPPEVLLPRVRRHLRYVTQLADARATLAQRRRLLVAGGWLSLLAATLHVDLRQSDAAAARLATARTLAEHADHPEVAAWCWETQAWDALTDGDYRRALDLSQRAQAIAPAGSSALIQATAQEGRAWARIGRSAETRDALARVARLVSPRPMPDQPEHHFVYDPAKAMSYTATTLAWVGDPAAEAFARETVRRLEAAPDGVRRPRRVASARLDLGLALLAAGKPDEAGAQALAAIESGRVVQSNWWRAAEVVGGVRRAGLPESADLVEALELSCRPPAADDSGR